MTEGSSNSVSINAGLAGWLAVALLVVAALLWYFVGPQNMWTGACLKVGLVMLALWMALPAIVRQSTLGKASWGTIVGTVAVVLLLIGKRVDIRIVLAMLFCTAIATKFSRGRR